MGFFTQPPCSCSCAGHIALHMLGRVISTTIELLERREGFSVGKICRVEGAPAFNLVVFYDVTWPSRRDN